MFKIGDPVLGYPRRVPALGTILYETSDYYEVRYDHGDCTQMVKYYKDDCAHSNYTCISAIDPSNYIEELLTSSDEKLREFAKRRYNLLVESK